MPSSSVNKNCAATLGCGRSADESHGGPAGKPAREGPTSGSGRADRRNAVAAFVCVVILACYLTWTSAANEVEGEYRRDDKNTPRALNREGAQPAPDGQTFIASIKRNLTGKHICTGALYSSFSVLLPASCLKGVSDIRPPETEPVVTVGDYDKTIKEEGNDQVKPAFNTTIHPNFTGSEEEGYANDIAVLLFSEPFTGHEPVKVSTGTCAEMESVGWLAPAFFGNVEGNPSMLKYIGKLKQLEDQNCTNHLKHGLPVGALCIVPSELYTACEWDHGALLLCNSTHDAQLVGLASYVTKDCGLSKNVPYMYTNVAKFKSWIDEVVDDHEKSKVMTGKYPCNNGTNTTERVRDE